MGFGFANRTSVAITLVLAPGLYTGVANCGSRVENLASLTVVGEYPAPLAFGTSSLSAAVTGYTVISCPTVGSWLSSTASHITLSNLTIADCTDGAVAVNSSTLVVKRGAFINNIYVISSPLGGGGAAIAAIASNVSVSEVVFHNNSVSGSGGCSFTDSCALQGGAVFVDLFSRLTTSVSQFINNAVSGPTASPQGGAISALGPFTLISECFFSENSVSSNGYGSFGYGGAVYLLNSGLVVNSGFVNNSALAPMPNGAAFGGAVALLAGGIISSSRFSTNSAISGGEGASSA